MNYNVRFWPIADMPKNAIDVAVGGKADIGRCTANVRLRPKADIPLALQISANDPERTSLPR
jgi:hypothetical protein